jgi:hypothetical protein
MFNLSLSAPNIPSREYKSKEMEGQFPETHRGIETET